MASNTTVPVARSTSRGWSARLASLAGWVLLGCGAGILLYLAYALLYTNVGTARAQAALRQTWERQIAAAPVDGVRVDAGRTDPSGAGPVGQIAGGGVALVEFARPDGDGPLVHDTPLVVLDGVSPDRLADGPGHYPGTALPGRDGNFAVAGHRTTHGAPFYHLDALRSGDRIRVTDRRGSRYTYEVAETRVVGPSDTWVLADDPLGTGRPTMTLTTCNPRFSAAERLVVLATLAS